MTSSGRAFASHGSAQSGAKSPKQGQLAQWESACFTRRRSQVQSLHCPHPFPIHSARATDRLINASLPPNGGGGAFSFSTICGVPVNLRSSTCTRGPIVGKRRSRTGTSKAGVDFDPARLDGGQRPFSRGSVTATRQAHNLEITGSIPVPATHFPGPMNTRYQAGLGVFINERRCTHEGCYIHDPIKG